MHACHPRLAPSLAFRSAPPVSRLAYMHACILGSGRAYACMRAPAFAVPLPPYPGLVPALSPAQLVALRNVHLRVAILEALPSIATFTDIAGVMAVAGRADGTIESYGREFVRLRKFAADFNFAPIHGPAEVGFFLSDESQVATFIGFLANKGFAYKSVHKILFALRACSIAPGVPTPPPFSRYVNLVLKGYEAIIVPPTPRPVITVGMYHFIAEHSLDDLVASETSVQSAFLEVSRPLVRLARWRAMSALGFFGALRRSEYLGSALRASCVSFEGISAARLRLLSADQSISLRALWSAVVEALEPRAVVSINIAVSKTNRRPEQRLIERDAGNPNVCPVAALAFWWVLLGPHISADAPFFALPGSGASPYGPSAEEVTGPLRYYLRQSNLLSPEEVERVSLHAMRHGGASSAILGGASREESKCLGRWRGNSDAIYTATTKNIQGLAATIAISRALAAYASKVARQ